MVAQTGDFATAFNTQSLSQAVAPQKKSAAEKRPTYVGDGPFEMASKQLRIDKRLRATVPLKRKKKGSAKETRKRESGTIRDVYGALVCFANKDGECKPHKETLKLVTGRSENCILDAIDDLVDCGYLAITFQSKGRGSNEYRLLPPPALQEQDIIDGVSDNLLKLMLGLQPRDHRGVTELQPRDQELQPRDEATSNRATTARELDPVLEQEIKQESSISNGIRKGTSSNDNVVTIDNFSIPSSGGDWEDQVLRMLADAIVDQRKAENGGVLLDEQQKRVTNVMGYRARARRNSLADADTRSRAQSLYRSQPSLDAREAVAILISNTNPADIEKAAQTAKIVAETIKQLEADPRPKAAEAEPLSTTSEAEMEERRARRLRCQSLPPVDPEAEEYATA